MRRRSPRTVSAIVSRIGHGDQHAGAGGVTAGEREAADLATSCRRTSWGAAGRKPCLISALPAITTIPLTRRSRPRAGARGAIAANAATAAGARPPSSSWRSRRRGPRRAPWTTPLASEVVCPAHRPVGRGQSASRRRWRRRSARSDPDDGRDGDSHPDEGRPTRFGPTQVERHDSLSPSAAGSIQRRGSRSSAVGRLRAPIGWRRDRPPPPARRPRRPARRPAPPRRADRARRRARRRRRGRAVRHRRVRGGARRAEERRQARSPRPRATRSRRCWRRPRTLSRAGQGRRGRRRRGAARRSTDAASSALPNPASAEAPEGGEDDFVVLETVGTPRDFAAEGFEPRDHLELGQLLGAIDTERGAKVSGARFYYLTGVGAQLELALTQLAMSKAAEWGFTPMIPPALVKPSAMEGTGFLGQAADDVYYLEKDDLYLVGTSEVPLAAYHSDEILDAESLAAALRRVQPLLPPRGRLVRQGHPRHLPRALVRQGRDVRVHDARGVVRRARAHPRLGAGLARRCSSCPTASSTSRPATSASRPSASSTARRGSRRRASTARCRRRPTAPQFQARRLDIRTRRRRESSTAPRRSPRSTARSAP